MKENIFIAHYNKQLAAYRRYFRKALKNGSMEDVHKLRVSIKKLRSLWALAEVASGGKWKSRASLGLVEHLFRAGGKLRETQLNLSLIPPDQAGPMLPYAAYLKKSQRRLYRGLVRRMQAFDRKNFDAANRLLRRKMRDVPGEKVAAGAASLALRKSQKVMALAASLPDARKLHKIRIRQKEVLEMLAVMKKYNPGMDVDPVQSRIRLLNEQIGRWHDTGMLLDSLRQYAGKTRDNKGRRPWKSQIEDLDNRQATEGDNLCRLLEIDGAKQAWENLKGML